MVQSHVVIHMNTTEPSGQPQGQEATSRMGGKGRAVVILLGLLTVLSLAGAGVGFWLQRQEHELRLAKEQELLRAKKENDRLKDQISEVTKAKELVEVDLASAKTELIQATQQLEEEHAAKEQLAKSVADRQDEVSRLGKDLEQLRSERTELTERLTKLTTQQKTLETKVGELESAKSDLEAKVLELSSQPSQPTVELDKVVVNEGGESSTATSAKASDASAKGQVVVVNREYDFVVMNLGKKQGVEIGQEFQIERDHQVLGRVKVEKLYDELSAAAILPDSKKDAIHEGDLVKAP